MVITINRRSILAALFVGAAVFAFVWWLYSPPSKANAVRPLLRELEAYRAVNGAYPTSCVNLVTYPRLTRRFSIYTGELGTNEVTWDPFEVSKHDFTVLVGPAGYEVFLPVGRIKLISFSSFPVWHIDSWEHRWQKGRIHWSWIGTFWSEK
jgi:hypothetical protein